MSFHLSIVTDLTKLHKNSTRTQFTMIMILIMIQLSIPQTLQELLYFWVLKGDCSLERKTY